MTNSRRRLRYVDGLRGVAVLMVIVYHAHFHLPAAHVFPGPLDSVILQGYQGVSLFLVLSGFCLAYPFLLRRANGEADRLQLSAFFARRCLRILPPYYVAFAMFAGAGYLLWHASHTVALTSIGKPASAANLIAHVLLVHNLVPAFTFTGNGSFWSLGLEWQWYLVFPAVLAVATVRPAWAALLALALLLAWHFSTHDLLQLAVSGRYISAALPERLFEFTCGVLAARTLATGGRVSLYTLLGALLLPVPAFLLLPGPIAQASWGLAFGALVLLPASLRSVDRLLSSSPLVRLGTVSYSVYLVHEPCEQLIAVVRSDLNPAALMLLEVVVAVWAGTIFYLLVERPTQSARARQWWVPRLERALRPLDRLNPAVPQPAKPANGLPVPAQSG